MPLIKYHLYAHHKELNQDVCIMKTSKRYDLKRFFKIFTKYTEDYHWSYFDDETATNIKTMVSDFKLQYDLINFNINDYDSFYFYDSKTKEIYDAIFKYDVFSCWELRMDNPDQNGSYSIIDKYKRQISNMGKYYYKHFLSCPNPDCSWCEERDSYLFKINAPYRTFINNVLLYYTDEDIDYPDKVTYIDVPLIKECPQCHIPFNGKVQIKKEF